MTTSAEESISSITERIVERFHPLQVILFGSQARGDVKADSDVDLLVVLPDPRDWHQAWREIREALREFTVPHNVVVTTPSKIARRGNLVGPVLRPALRDGKVLYDADVGLVNWGADMAEDGPSAPVAGTVSDEERLAETERWL